MTFRGPYLTRFLPVNRVQDFLGNLPDTLIPVTPNVQVSFQLPIIARYVQPVEQRPSLLTTTLAISAQNYTITAAQGTYTVTGKAQALNSTRTITATQGTYTATGEAQFFGIGLPASKGTYTLTGEPQVLNRGIGISAAQGSYTVTGTAPVQQLTLGTIASGTYTLTGEPQKFTIALSCVAAQGSYNLSGKGQVLSKGGVAGTGGSTRRFIADMGQMTENG